MGRSPQHDDDSTVRQVTQSDDKQVGSLDTTAGVIKGRLDIATDKQPNEVDSTPNHTVEIELNEGRLEVSGDKTYLTFNDRTLQYAGRRRISTTEVDMNRQIITEDVDDDEIETVQEIYIEGTLAEALTDEEKAQIDIDFSYHSKYKAIEYAGGGNLIEEVKEDFSEIDGVGSVTMDSLELDGSNIYDLMRTDRQGITTDYKHVSVDKKKGRLKDLISDTVRREVKNGRARLSYVIKLISNRDDLERKALEAQHKTGKNLKNLAEEQAEEALEESIHEANVLEVFKTGVGSYTVLLDTYVHRLRMDWFRTETHVGTDHSIVTLEVQSRP